MAKMRSVDADYKKNLVRLAKKLTFTRISEIKRIFLYLEKKDSPGADRLLIEKIEICLYEGTSEAEGIQFLLFTIFFSNSQIVSFFGVCWSKSLGPSWSHSKKATRPLSDRIVCNFHSQQAEFPPQGLCGKIPDNSPSLWPKIFERGISYKSKEKEPRVLLFELWANLIFG
jgi:hypothetical protein